MSASVPSQTHIGIGFDEEPTVIEVRQGDLPEAPPPLPFALTQKKRTSMRWLHELPEPAQQVLERARTRAPSWPLMPRFVGAVCVPIDD
ncbi:MAG: hypothetical protein AAGF12_26060 [Myxococcota bacterium]